MSTPIHDYCIAPLLRALKNLDGIVGKADALLAADKGIAEATLINARLYPNMLPFVAQIRIATDTAKGAAARLSGTELPRWADEETTFAELHERVGKAIDFLSGFEAADFSGAEDRDIELKFPSITLNFKGMEYVNGFVMPNFYFHMTTAYDILRHNGADLGKRDFLGGD